MEAQTGSRSIILLILYLDVGYWRVVKATIWPLYPRERPGTHNTGGWVGIAAGLDRCGKFRPNRSWNPEPYSPWWL